MESTPESDAIWNRAASAERLPPEARAGDRALRAALELHGYVMNGGLDHGLDVMGADGVERAAEGWEFLGRTEVADLLREVVRTVPDLPADPEERAEFLTDGWSDEQAARIEQLDHRYPEDRSLEEAFLRCLRDRPDDFAPDTSEAR